MFETWIQRTSVRNISLGGICLTGESAPNLETRPVAFVTIGNKLRQFPCRTVFRKELEGSVSICGLQFEDRSVTGEDLVSFLRGHNIKSETADKNLTAYFEHLLARQPSLKFWISDLATEDLLKNFEALQAGESLKAPKGFDRQVKAVVGGDWQIALFLASRWALTQGYVLSDSQTEELTYGLLWGTLLIGLVEHGLARLEE